MPKASLPAHSLLLESRLQDVRGLGKLYCVHCLLNHLHLALESYLSVRMGFVPVHLEIIASDYQGKGRYKIQVEHRTLRAREGSESRDPEQWSSGDPTT